MFLSGVDILFTILINLVQGSCPSGYSERSGDVAGWGTDIGSKLPLTRQECANSCNENSLCLSFEHSNTELLCNLNKIAEPTEGLLPFQDYAFCVKTGMIAKPI